MNYQIYYNYQIISNIVKNKDQFQSSIHPSHMILKLTVFRIIDPSMWFNVVVDFGFHSVAEKELARLFCYSNSRINHRFLIDIDHIFRKGVGGDQSNMILNSTTII